MKYDVKGELKTETCCNMFIYLLLHYKFSYM